MIQYGIDILLAENPAWKTQRIALLTNHAAATRDSIPSAKALQNGGFHLIKLFSPEHGMDVRGTDGHLMKDGTDPLTGLPVISLYGNKLMPSEEDLSDIDIVLFDIPDAGSRFYTYLWTMTYVLEACAQYDKPFVLLDRPNPVSGNMDLTEGPMLYESQSSFIGRWPIPIRHSCTLGELALYFNASRNIGCRLEVIKCEGWDRNMFQPDWGIPFVATSPAIHNFQSMLLYPGLCLLEATNISEGRSTAYSFIAAGTPWMDANKLSDTINEMWLDEVKSSSLCFTPTGGKYAGHSCSGIRLEVIAPKYFKPVFFGVLLIKIIRQIHPTHFEWNPYPTLVNPSGNNHLDKLMGVPESEMIFDLPLGKFIAHTQKITDAGAWKEMISGYLLY